MPTVLRRGNVRIAVLTRNEHEPPHVHVEHPDGTVVVLLTEATGGAELREATRKMKAADIRAIVALVAENYDECLATWKRVHR